MSSNKVRTSKRERSWKFDGVSGIIPMRARVRWSWWQLWALSKPLSRGGPMARHSGTWTLCTLRVAVAGPCMHNVVSHSHRWMQQRVPHVGVAKMCGATAHNVGMGGTTSAHWPY